MKKIIKAVLAAAIMCVAALAVSVCVSAEDELTDVELATSMAKTTDGGWGQSVTYPKSSFDCSRITEDTIIEVEFELDGEWTSSGAPVELIFQNYSTADPAIWAKIEPYDSDLETYAKFRYDEMAATYGSEDFSTVDNMCLGDCGIKMKVTKFVVKNCKEVEIVTTTTTAETTTAAETTTTAAESVTEAPAETEAAAESGSSGGIPIVLIVVITVVVAVAVVVVVIVLKNRKRFY